MYGSKNFHTYFQKKILNNQRKKSADYFFYYFIKRFSNENFKIKIDFQKRKPKLILKFSNEILKSEHQFTLALI